MKNLFLNYWGCSLILFGGGTAFAIEPATVLDPSKYESIQDYNHYQWQGPYIPDDSIFTTTTTTYANPGLKKCWEARQFTPAPINPDDFDCVPNTDADGKLTNAADKDYKNWNDVLYYGKDKSKPITGFYTKKGKRCDGLTAATKECPVAAKAKFVVTCNTADPTSFQNGKCIAAKDIKVYRAVYQAFEIPGEKKIKTTVVGDSDISGFTAPALPVSTSAIIADTAVGKCPATDNDGNPLFQKGSVNGFPICETDTVVDNMRKDICSIQMKEIWQNGGTSKSPCKIVTVTKIFKLNNPGKTNYTTNDCLVTAQGALFNDAGSAVSNLNAYPGGILTGAFGSEAQFKADYGITSNSPTFTCKKRITKTESKDFTSSGTILLSSYVPGSLTINGMVGGGAGGGASDQNGGGIGGGAGSFNAGQMTEVKSDQSCTVTIGAGGSGANANVDNGCCSLGSDGGTTKVACAEKSMEAAGGARGYEKGKGCRGTASGSGGGGSSYGGGGAGASCGVGGGAVNYGAGGGGGGTDGVKCGCHSGGGGASGFVNATWQVYEWVIW